MCTCIHPARLVGQQGVQEYACLYIANNGVYSAIHPLVSSSGAINSAVAHSSQLTFTVPGPLVYLYLLFNSDAVSGRVAFPSAEVRCIERDGTSEVIYGGIAPRVNAPSLGIHTGTHRLYSCVTFIIV